MLDDKQLMSRVKFYRVTETEAGLCLMSGSLPLYMLKDHPRAGLTQQEAVDKYIAKYQAIIDEAIRIQEQARALLKGEE